MVKTIFINGSRHSIYWWGENKVNIGCWQFSFEVWQTKINDGKLKENYTDLEIAEYQEYMTFIKSQYDKTL